MRWGGGGLCTVRPALRTTGVRRACASGPGLERTGAFGAGPRAAIGDSKTRSGPAGRGLAACSGSPGVGPERGAICTSEFNRTGRMRGTACGRQRGMLGPDADDRLGDQGQGLGRERRLPAQRVQRRRVLAPVGDGARCLQVVDGGHGGDPVREAGEDLRRPSLSLSLDRAAASYEGKIQRSVRWGRCRLSPGTSPTSAPHAHGKRTWLFESATEFVGVAQKVVYSSRSLQLATRNRVNGAPPPWERRCGSSASRSRGIGAPA